MAKIIWRVAWLMAYGWRSDVIRRSRKQQVKSIAWHQYQHIAYQARSGSNNNDAVTGISAYRRVNAMRWRHQHSVMAYQQHNKQQLASTRWHSRERTGGETGVV